MRVALFHMKVGRRRAQLGRQLGRRAAQRDAEVTGRQAAAEGREATATGGSEEEDRLLRSSSGRGRGHYCLLSVGLSESQLDIYRCEGYVETGSELG